MSVLTISRALLPAMALLASCGMTSPEEERGQPVDNAAGPVGDHVSDDANDAFTMEAVARFDRPWAIAVEPDSGTLFVTEKRGTIGFLRRDGRRGEVRGVPNVAYGGQGGLGDFIFAPDYATSRTVYLSWAEAGPNQTRGAAVGRARLVCEDDENCDLADLRVIWRQPKVSGAGHYSHRLAFSPDGTRLFVSSGDRQKGDPAQDTGNSLGTIVRLLPDGTPAPGNPLADQRGADPAIWSWGHRNMLGLDFDRDGQLWAIEHGPRGGDELNRIEPGRNYGWPLVSNGDHYGGGPIPDHATRPDLAAPAISWSPVIAPGGMTIYRYERFARFAGRALIVGLKSRSLVVVAIDDPHVREEARYRFDHRLRAIAQADDGSLWIAEDGPDATLWRVTPG